MSKLAVFFPGIGYTVDKPLMHYSRRIARDLGYEVKLLPYAGFPDKVRGDGNKMRESYEIALNQAKEMLKDVDFSSYDDILFIGKSVGTIVAATLAAESRFKNKIRLVLYTPLEETFSFDFGTSVVFTGTADPWVGGIDSKIMDICRERQISCEVFEDANHSLETSDYVLDLEYMTRILKVTEKFIGGM